MLVATGGRILGTGDGTEPPLPTGANNEDLRKQLHTKWEHEKQMQKRVLQLEQRLKERIDENSDLQEQLKRARMGVQQVTSQKENIAQKVVDVSRSLHETKRSTADGAAELEDARSRVFQLEELVASIRRRADVQLPAEISQLKQQVASYQKRVSELQADLSESEGGR